MLYLFTEKKPLYFTNIIISKNIIIEIYFKI